MAAVSDVVVRVLHRVPLYIDVGKGPARRRAGWATITEGGEVTARVDDAGLRRLLAADTEHFSIGFKEGTTRSYTATPPNRARAYVTTLPYGGAPCPTCGNVGGVHRIDCPELAPPPYIGDEPLGCCPLHGDYWTEDCTRCHP